MFWHKRRVWCYTKTCTHDILKIQRIASGCGVDLPCSLCLGLGRSPCGCFGVFSSRSRQLSWAEQSRASCHGINSGEPLPQPQLPHKPLRGGCRGTRELLLLAQLLQPARPQALPHPRHHNGAGLAAPFRGKGAEKPGEGSGKPGEGPRAAGPCEGFPAAGRDMAAPCFLGWDFSTQQVPRPPPSPPRAEITSLQQCWSLGACKDISRLPWMSIKCFPRGCTASRKPIKPHWVRAVLKLAPCTSLVMSCASA